MVQDKYLVWQFNRGQREALHQIYERHKDRLMGLATALLTNVAQAEDVVHDVFIGFIQAAGTFKLTGSLRAYLTTCVANAARNRNKAEYQRRHASLEDIAPPTAGRQGDPEFNAIFGEDAGRLAWALEQLPYEQREVLILRASPFKVTRIVTAAVHGKCSDRSRKTLVWEYRHRFITPVACHERRHKVFSIKSLQSHLERADPAGL